MAGPAGPARRPTHLLNLDDARAREPEVAGAKAATLARARAAGLPCLPGWVVPVGAGRDVLRRGEEALESGGSGQARLVVMATAPDARVLVELAGLVRAVPGPVVVRSSSIAEDDPVWAGAFSSFTAVRADDVATAVSGVWASAFSVDALRRCAALGVPVAGGGLAILVQPELDGGPGGSARLLPDGAVQVVVIRGVPGGSADPFRPPLRAVVDGDGRARGAAADALGTERTAAVARLVRRVRAVLGLDLIEWGWAGGSVVLLQARRAATRVPRPAPAAPSPAALGGAPARRVAAAATRFPGPLGESLVLPWALGCIGRVPDPSSEPVADPYRALAQAVLLAGALAAQAWGVPAPAARRRAGQVLSAVRGPRPQEALARLADLARVDEGTGRRVVTLLGGVAAAMAGAGLVPGTDEVWRHDEEGLRRILAGELTPPRVRVGPDRWEPFLYQVVAAQGAPLTGVPAAPGVGAGPLRVIDRPGATASGGHRAVLLARHPVPELASLLWSAAGLVTGPGDPGAHLFEVAASLGVPAVVDADVEALCAAARNVGDRREVLAAVDGASGTMWMLDLDGVHRGGGRPSAGFFGSDDDQHGQP